MHNLEHGYSLLWYDETVAKDADQLAQVKAIAAKFEGQKLTDKFIAVPWTSKDGKPFPGGAHVALTHWSVGGDPTGKSQKGVWQYCVEPERRRGRHLRQGLPLQRLPRTAGDVRPPWGTFSACSAWASPRRCCR